MKQALSKSLQNERMNEAAALLPSRSAALLRSAPPVHLSPHGPSRHDLCVHEPFSEPSSSAVKASKV